MKWFLLLLISNVSFASEAINKAIEATYIQTGLKQKVQMVTSHMEYKSKIYTQKIGIQKEVATALLLYKIYKDNAIIVPVGKGRKLKVSPTYLELGIPF